MRMFTDSPAVRSRVPLIVGVTGSSFSGKTYSALRLAAGIERVVGGPIWVVDSESNRALHYAEYFRFQHVPFPPPYGPLDYIEVLEHCVKKGAKIVVVDQMSFEHNGEGGVMDQSEAFLEKKCGDDWKCREKNLMLSLVKPKLARKKLKRWIITHGDVVFIFLYRAADKIKPVRGGEPIKLGWQPETTSDLPYEMTARFLLTPGCEGVPMVTPDEKAELMQIKNPRQFKSLIHPGEQLSEDLGERMARWAVGGSADGAASAGGGAAPAASQAALAAARPAARAPGVPMATAAQIEELGNEITRLDWSREATVEWLKKNYGVATRAELTEEKATQAIMALMELGS
jgi:hypothetical protein